MSESILTSTKTTKRAVVLVSGGLDSATVLAIARSQGFECYALSMDYGQRHRIELERAKAVADSLGATEHRVVKIDIGTFGGSAYLARALFLLVPTQLIILAILIAALNTYKPFKPWRTWLQKQA